MRTIKRTVAASLLAATMVAGGAGIAQANIIERLAAQCLATGGWLESVQDQPGGGWSHTCHYDV